MWDVGLTVMQFGIYQSKEAKTFKGKTGTLQEMKDTPTVMFYDEIWACLLYTSPSPRDGLLSRMPSSA